MTSPDSVIKSGLTLAGIAAICTSLVATTYHLTADRIAANDKALLEQSLQPALSNLFYDSGVSESRLVLKPPHDLPGSEEALIYRVYANDEPVFARRLICGSIWPVRPSRRRRSTRHSARTTRWGRPSWRW